MILKRWQEYKKDDFKYIKLFKDNIAKNITLKA